MTNTTLLMLRTRCHSGSMSGVGGGLAKAGTGALILSESDDPSSGGQCGYAVSLGQSRGVLGGTGTIAPASAVNVTAFAGGPLSHGASMGTLTVNWSGEELQRRGGITFGLRTIPRRLIL